MSKKIGCKNKVKFEELGFSYEIFILYKVGLHTRSYQFDSRKSCNWVGCLWLQKLLDEYTYTSLS